MPRVAFRMKVHNGQEAEYIRRHNPIWPELEAALREHGVETYSIFLDRNSNDLFGYLEIGDQAKLNDLAATEICRQWWDYMAELMPVNSDNSPVMGNLEEVFHIEVEEECAECDAYKAGRSWSEESGPPSRRS